MNYFLTDEVLRLQKLAGIETKLQEPTLEDILLEAYIGLYCLQNNLLLENLDEGLMDRFKGFKDKFINAIGRLNLNPTTGLVASMLNGLKNISTDEGYKEIIQIIKDYDGPKNIKQIMDYVKNIFDKKLNEGMSGTWVRKGNDFKLWAKTSIITITLAILLKLTTIAGFDLAQANVDKVPPTTNIELTQNDAQEVGFTDSNQNIFQKINQAADEITGGENTGGDIGDNPVTTDSDGKVIKVGFDTGDFEISDEDETTQKIIDDIEKETGGKKIKKLTLKVKGLISNTPGAGDDDPNGPGKEGLAQKRLDAGKKIAEKVKADLEKKYPDSKITIEDGGTNVNDIGPETEVDSEEAKNNQVFSIDTADLETEDEKSINLPDDPLTYFRRPKDLQPDGNKYYTILGYFLPLITNNKQPSEEFMKILDMKEGEIVNDSFINKKLSELPKQYPLDSPKVKEAGNVMRILYWARNVKKDPKIIGRFFNSLDPKIDIPWEKRKLIKPGEKGKAAFTAGSGTTQTPAPGSQAQDRIKGAGATPNPNLGEIKLFSIYENLLLEATVGEWAQLPDYDAVAAKNNLGELVPLYVYTWDIGDNGALKYISGIDDKGNIDSNNPYKSSWKKFENKYPVLWKKATNDLEYLKNNEKSDKSVKSDGSTKPGNKSDNTSVLFDKSQNKTKNTTETNRVITFINSNSAIKTALNKINTVEEFKQLILLLLLDKFPVYKDNKPALRTALSKIQARIQPRNEKGQFINLKEENTPDVKRLEDLLGSNAATQLKAQFKNINTEEEIIQLIVRAIIPYLNPNLKGSTQSLKQAITKAQTEFNKQSNSSNDINIKELFVKTIKGHLKK